MKLNNGTTIINVERCPIKQVTDAAGNHMNRVCKTIMYATDSSCTGCSRHREERKQRYFPFEHNLKIILDIKL